MKVTCTQWAQCPTCRGTIPQSRFHYICGSIGDTGTCPLCKKSELSKFLIVLLDRFGHRVALDTSVTELEIR